MSCHGENLEEAGSSGVLEANLKARRKLSYAAGFCLLFMIAEVIGGYFANSLAIMTDAAHLLSDLAGFFISIFALWVSTRPATSRMSFGFHRAEILGAILSVLLIWLLTGFLLWEAVRRIQKPQPVNGRLMLIVSAIGLLINIIMGYILYQADVGHSHGLSGAHSHSHGGSDDHAHEHAHSHGGHDEAHNHGHAHGQNGIDKHHDNSRRRTKRYPQDQSQKHGQSKREHDFGDEPNAGSKLVQRDRQITISYGTDSKDGCKEDKDHGPTDKKSVKNINVESAFIHVVGDALQSLGVMMAAGAYLG